MICPLTLLSSDNGVFLYQLVDCSTLQNAGTTSSSTPLQLGCCDTNPACFEALTSSKPTTSAGKGTTAAGAAASAKKGDATSAPAPAHFVRPDLAKRGLSAPLAAGAVWALSNAAVPPDYQGDKAYFVVKVDGKDRYIRVLNATVTPPMCLAIRKAKGKTQTHHPVPGVVVRIGQECIVPAGVKPRAMVLVEGPAEGEYVIVARPRGKTGAEHEFHVLLSS